MIRQAFFKSLPVMAGYLVLGIGFGILLQVWKRNPLLSILAGTLLYMFFVQVVF